MATAKKPAKGTIANVVRALRDFAAALPPQESGVEEKRQDLVGAADAYLGDK